MEKNPKAHLYEDLPSTPGVYLMRNKRGVIIYVGKAVNLKRRVSSYFTRPQDARISALVNEVVAIDHEDAGSALEALIVEAARIKEFLPFYNIEQKDDKSFTYVEFTEEDYPRVQLVRGRSPIKGRRYGPFLADRPIREGMQILRRIIPYATHAPGKLGERPCFDYQIGLCPGTCAGLVDRRTYRAAIRKLELILSGKQKQVTAILKRDMRAAAHALEFERAEKIRRTLFALEHVNDTSIITREEVQRDRERTVRVEGYDISNTMGNQSVGSMVVFVNGEPEKASYRLFKIKSVSQPDDYASLAEVISRRIGHDEWPMPDVFLIDGGAGQVHAVKTVLRGAGIKVPVVGIAKGAERKRDDIIGAVPHTVSVETLIRVRDEAHRFAIKNHRKMRGKAMFY
jgi:excinuclease ABC subunit C